MKANNDYFFSNIIRSIFINLFTGLILMIDVQPVFAEVGDQQMIVNLKDGSKVSLALFPEEPEEFNFEIYTVEDNSNDQLTYRLMLDIADCTFEIDNIRSYCFRSPSSDSGIESTFMTEFPSITFIDNNTFRLSGVKKESIKVYDIEGLLRPVEILIETDSLIIGIGVLTAGMYILNTGNYSIKFIKR